jgi:hypothetical protein
VNGNAGTLAVQGPGNGGTDATTGAGNQGPFARER